MPDPEFDDKPAGACQRCSGTKWVQVQPAYAERMFPPPADLPEGATDEQLRVHAAVVADADRCRRAAADSFYPCKDCAPTLFFRWAGGHLAIDHDRASCAECYSPPARRRAS